MKVPILSVSDVENYQIYSPAIVEKYKTCRFIISCGDLAHYYLEYIISQLNVPLYFVYGNHTQIDEFGNVLEDRGGKNLHLRTVRDKSGVLLAGIEGSHLYNYGLHQYTQSQMWQFAWRLVPLLMANKVRYQRYLDILITHAPPWKVHDEIDIPHQGIKAFQWINKVFQPKYHFHGHIHIYNPEISTQTRIGKTLVVNAFDHKAMEIEV